MPKDSSSPQPTLPSEDQVASELKEAHATLKTRLNEYLPLRPMMETDVQSILTLYEKIRQECNVDGTSTSQGTSNCPISKLSNYHRSKLKTAYNNSLKNLNTETERLTACLEQVHEIRRLREEKRRVMIRKQAAGATSTNILSNESAKSLIRCQTPPTSTSSTSRDQTRPGGYGLRRGALMMLLQRSAASLPLWIGDGENEEAVEEAPSLCGAVPAPADHVCDPGDMVAVKAVVQNGDENWILAEVKSHDSSTGKYEVEDIDEEEKQRYVINKKALIPLPRYRAHPQLNPSALFDVNAIVWALYPQTTCFYKGVVERRPAGPNDPYLVAFEDSSYPNGYSLPLAVPQRYVIAQN